ncbi:uncharacterized protein EDB91DRAFT_1161471 [Suillus paluster]|uniref:uncharacterized protein n=1 Tax=Suillus paluster TaxID=48578 RepID=UPI001B875F7E|nr:uncharacterized protein EDB91DRAFT_1161471 [Suillus paluster]KAG1728644.1 hypothetical protein EDB91DRAFT_1161471 [Suillus paluster]
MSGWKSIIFDDPSSDHPMLPLVVRVMKCIYSTVDPTRPPPSTVDNWRRSPSLSYKVHESGREPSIVILNLREGEEDHPRMNTHFMINLNTMFICDKFKNNRFPAPQEILASLGELRDYVWSIVRGRWEAAEAIRREEVRRLEKKREEQRNRVQAFCRCLVEKGLIDEHDFSSDSLHCPVCSAKQTSCNMCKIISCSNSDCKVSSAIPIVQCFNHPSNNICISCLERPGSLPRLGECPSCAHWFCAQELEWCVGRPISNGNTSGTGPSSPTIVVTRLHSAHPFSCQSIACVANTQASGKNGRRCCNTTCWSRVGTTVCPDCITQDSFSCPCGRYWTCGGCISSAWILRCPGCHRRFCPQCSYIVACEECKDVGFCHDCMEEEESIGVQHAQSADLVFKCRNCRAFLCKTCVGVEEKFCYKCDRDLCKLCGDDATTGDDCEMVCDECRNPASQYDVEEMVYYDDFY